MSGFFKVSKGLSAHEMFKTNPHYLAGYIWLLDNASFTERVVRFAGQNWDLKPGQIVITIRKLSTALAPWGFTEKTTRRFIENLKRFNMVKAKAHKSGQVLTLKQGTHMGTPQGTVKDTAQNDATPQKTSHFTDQKTEQGTPKGTDKGTPMGTQIEEGKKKGITPLTPQGEFCVEKLFSEFWEKWPSHHRKIGKTTAKREFTKMAPAKCQDVINALEAAKASEQWKKDGGKYIPKPANWLKNGEYWAHIDAIRAAKEAETKAQERAEQRKQQEAQERAKQFLETGYEAYLDSLAEEAAKEADLEALEKELPQIARRSLRNHGATSPMVRSYLFAHTGVKPKSLNQWSKEK